jgi:autotransporter-associated beta strand protein
MACVDFGRRLKSLRQLPIRASFHAFFIPRPRNVNKGGTIVVSATIGQASSGLGFTLRGGGTLTLSGANTYTGVTNVTTPYSHFLAVRWTDGQEIVWPIAGNKKAVKDAKFTTEEFVEAVIDDVAGKHKLDPQRVFTLTWSSSGPAAYAVSFSSKKVTGSLVAMSVFRPDWLPDLKSAKGHAYYLYHSPDDRVCPYRMAQQAEKDLTQAGAKVKLVDYEGGHGWRGPLYDDIRAGIEWLETNHANSAKQ